jgi:multidrug efflux system outer membrane protein
MRKLTFLLIVFGLGLLTACMVGPNYKRPKVTVPTVYRGEAQPASKVPSLGNEKWWQVFRDPVLEKLIRTALAQNYDVRIAATRILAAQAQVGITRASQFPSANAAAGIFTEQNPKISKVFPSYEVNAGHLSLSAIWDLDFWGKYRRLTEAARAEMLASEWGQRAVLSSVVASVAASYFQMRALDSQLAIAKRTLASRRESLRLTQVLEKNGSASMLEVSEAQQLVYTASEAIPDIERQIALQENLLSTLLGQNPGPIPRGRPITQQPAPASVPAGLPSELIERRPDIREAEGTLIAANANIGALKASLFPSISLTGTGGLESYALNRLISEPAQMWNAAVNVTQPVFEAGAIRSGVRLAKAQWQQMLLSYRQTILVALQQVSDALVAYRKDREYTREQQQLVNAARESDRLSMVLYRHGGASYLQVLTNETNLFAAELNLVQAQANERLALVQLYQALGGGWQQH